MSQNVPDNNEMVKAMVHLAKATGDSAHFAGTLSKCIDIIGAHPEIMRFLADPAVSARGKEEALHELLTPAASGVIHLILLLAETGYSSRLIPLRDQFFEALSMLSQKHTGELTSAVPVKEEILLQIEKEISRILLRKVSLRTRIDKTLLGGIKVQVGEMVFDGTVDTQVERMQQALLKGDAA